MTDDELIEIVQDCEDIIDEGRDEDEISPIELRNILDLVETIAERKPLHILRGLVHPIWHDYIRSNEDQWGLCYTVAAPWDTADPTAAWHPVMRKYLAPNEPSQPLARIGVPCFSAAEALIAQVDDLGQYVSAQQEATLLGYPVCCVHAYHVRHHTYARHIADAYRVACNGNAERLQELIEQDVPVPIDSAAAETFKNGYLSPVCSFAYCDYCAGDAHAPGPQINRARQRWFHTIAPDLLARLDRINARDLGEGHTWDAQQYFIDGLVWSRDVNAFFLPP